MVCKQAYVESKEWGLLLLQCFLSRGYAGGRQDSWRRSCICHRSARREVTTNHLLSGYRTDAVARHEASAELWQETYLSAILRAILYADDTNYRLIGYRKLDPITSRESEIRFLQAAEALFTKGWQLGSDPEIQVASLVSNHLTAGIMKYFGDNFRLGQAANLFEKLIINEPDVASLLARSYIGMSMCTSHQHCPLRTDNLCRRRGQSRSNHGIGNSRESAVLHPSARSM